MKLEEMKGWTTGMQEVVVLRWGHRLRDKRLTTHVALTARALGASKLVLSDVRDEKIKEKTEGVSETRGDIFFLRWECLGNRL